MFSKNAAQLRTCPASSTSDGLASPPDAVGMHGTARMADWMALGSGRKKPWPAEHQERQLVGVLILYMDVLILNDDSGRQAPCTLIQLHVGTMLCCMLFRECAIGASTAGKYRSVASYCSGHSPGRCRPWEGS